MACSAEYQAFLEDALAPLGGVRGRRMFGGVGLFRNDVMFALVVDDVPYFKVGEGNRPAFAAAGSEPFSYATKHGRHVLTSYWRVPDAVLDDEAELLGWARLAVDAAFDAAEAKPKRKRKGPPATA